MRGKFSPEEWARVQEWKRNGYLPTLETLAKRLTAPLWCNEPENPDTVKRMQNGTVCIVHTGTRLIGVSACHVHAAIADRLDSGASRWSQLGGHTFDPRACLIDCDPRLDIVTYSLSEIQINAANADIHHAPKWPPDVVVGDVYFVTGWPRALTESSEGTRTHKFLHFITKLAESSLTNLRLLTETSTSIGWGSEALPPGTDLGGMSGGAIYRVSETKLTELTLVGLIYEYSEESEYVLARPLSLVAEDGSIIRPRHGR